MRIAVIADTHYSVGPDTEDSALWNRQLLTETQPLAEALVKSIRKIAPDLVIHCGDLSHDGDKESLAFARETLNAFDCPYYVTTGNHDAVTSESRTALEGLFDHKNGRLSYRIEHGPLRLLFLDCSYSYHADGSESPIMDWKKTDGYLGIGPSRADLEWLYEQLREDWPGITFLVSHYPFSARPSYPALLPRDGRPPEDRMEPIDEHIFFTSQRESIHQALCSKGGVDLVLSGHWHIFDLVRAGGLSYCMTGSLIEYPFEFRVFDIDDSTISSNVHALDGAAKFSEKSLIPKLNNSWVAGSEGSRDFIFELNTHGREMP